MSTYNDNNSLAETPYEELITVVNEIDIFLE